MISPLGGAALSVLFGAVAGGVTNSVAIWMLFHPYRPPRILGRPRPLFQGAIPKNQPRLAAAVGRTVGQRLLTSEDLARTVAAEPFRHAFDERLAAFVAAILEREWGSLADELPPALAHELRTLAASAAGAVADRLDAYLDSAEFETAVHAWVRSLAADIGDQPLSEVLTAERETAIAQSADRWIAEAVGGTGFERAVLDYLDRTAVRLLRPGLSFEGLIPVGLVAALERAINGYLPIAIERLGGMLEGPQARRRLERVLHEILDRFMRDLKFHQRLIASLVITPETIDRVLEAIEAEGARKIAELLHEEEMRDAMARGVNDAVVEFLRRPVTSVLGAPGDASVEEAKRTLGGWALALARDEHTRTFLVEKLQATLRAAEHRTWNDLFRHLPPDRIADAVTTAARTARARLLYRDAIASVVARLVDRPIGQPARFLAPDTADRVRVAIAGPLWDWLQEQMPAVAQRIDVAGRVEQKINEFPMERLEDLIRGVTERELKLIVRLGYVLGAGIGLVSAMINLLLT